MAKLLEDYDIESALEIASAFIRHMQHTYFTKPSDYYEYIKSPEWKMKANDLKIDRGFRCQLCNISGYVTNLHVHHNTYERFGMEKDSDMIVLCADCHKTFHEHKKPQANKIELPEEEIRKILHFHGISPKNDHPWDYYTDGKRIIQHIIDGYDDKLYDKYNGVNIDICHTSIERQMREQEENDG